MCHLVVTLILLCIRFSVSAPFGTVCATNKWNHWLTLRQSVLHFAPLPELPELKRSLKSSSTICEAVMMIRAQPRGSVEGPGVVLCISIVFSATDVNGDAETASNPGLVNQPCSLFFFFFYPVSISNKC